MSPRRLQSVAKESAASMSSSACPRSALQGWSFIARSAAEYDEVGVAQDRLTHSGQTRQLNSSEAGLRTHETCD